MNIDRIREDTPYCQDKLFLNSAGASLNPLIVNQRVKAYLEEEEKIGGYKLADLREAEIETFYEEAAKLINCGARNIAFTSDATISYIKALSSIDFKSGDVIITTNDDYSSTQIQFLSLQKRRGVQIRRINNLDNGDLDLDHFKQLVDELNPRLVAIAHIPTNSGLVQDLEAIGEICADKEILYLVDACQSVGQLHVDVQKIKCDFLSTTGRKFLRGPRGTGFLYVSDKVLAAGYAPLLIDAFGGTWTEPDSFSIDKTAKRFETWEKPVAFMLGLKEAIRYANTVGISTIESYNNKLMTYFRQQLSTVSGVSIYDKGSKTCNLLTFRKTGKTLEEMQEHLDKHQVYYSVSTKEWGVIDYGRKGIDWTIRFSPHYFNTAEEMDQVVGIVESM